MPKAPTPKSSKLTRKQIEQRTYEYWRGARRTLLYHISVYGRPTEPQNMYRNPYAAARAEGKRSGFEVRVSKELDAAGITYEYEQTTLTYDIPASLHRYTPDFIFPNGIVVELKGEWDSADRKKITLVRQQHPDIDLRMVFNNPNSRISKKSNTTYATICQKLRIPFAAKHIPDEWLDEPTNHKSLAALSAFR